MKRIESPSKRWAGYVILHDPLTLGMVLAIEDARDNLIEVDEKHKSKLLQYVNEKRKQDGLDEIGVTWTSRSQEHMLPAILACVAEWHLEGFPDPVRLENFPASPRGECNKLVSWLWSEIDAVYTGDIEIPNES